jgi:hypothetical protein
VSQASIFTSKAYLDSVEELVFEMCKDIEDGLTDSMIDGDGLAYGDVPLSREERILKFVEDEESGVHVVLKVQDPDEFIRREDQFRRDVKDAGLD